MAWNYSTRIIKGPVMVSWDRAMNLNTLPAGPRSVFEEPCGKLQGIPLAVAVQRKHFERIGRKT